MESRYYKKNILMARLDLFQAVQGILNNSSDIIENLRIILNNWYRSELNANHMSYLGIVVVESDTDNVPRGRARLAYSDEELAIIDKEADESIQINLHCLIEDCKRLINEYKHEKLFPEEKAKLKIRKLALEIMDGQIESHGALGEILNLWPQTDLEENDLYFYVLGVYESGEPNAESFMSTMQDLVNYCDKMLIFPADSFD